MVVEPTKEAIEQAAAALKRGELVVMPTETVYGLAARAADPLAVTRTFAAKGRPADNPLIHHAARMEQFEGFIDAWPEGAAELAARFWPGPLSLIVPKGPRATREATAGLETVAVRIPAHPVALRLIDALGEPVTAPSANPFMGLSPTRAEHVAEGLAEIVLDGGACEVGLESTVLDLTGEPRIMRPGAISPSTIAEVLGRSVATGEEGVRKSPGMYPRHYAPKARVRIVERLESSDSGIVLGAALAPYQRALPSDPIRYGVGLYATLHDLDALGVDEILVERPPQGEAWDAVWDRLTRAGFLESGTPDP